MTIHNNTYLGRSIERGQTEIFVSLFENYSKPKPIGIVSLDEWLHSSHFQKEVEAIRNEKNKSRRRELKSKLPAITPSGIFSKRENLGLIQHSGIICIDIDQKDNPEIGDFSAVKDALAGLEGLFGAALSVSRNGLFLLFKTAYPEKHTEHFRALAADLMVRGLVVDAGCKEVSRLRGASYDPNPYYNPSVSPYKKLLILEIRPVVSTNLQNPSHTTFRVGKLVELIERTGANVADYYPDWYAIGRSLSAEFGESGRQWYHIISRQSKKYNLQECDKQYNYCLQSCSRTSISTFFGICKKFRLYANKLTPYE